MSKTPPWNEIQSILNSATTQVYLVDKAGRKLGPFAGTQILAFDPADVSQRYVRIQGAGIDWPASCLVPPKRSWIDYVNYVGGLALFSGLRLATTKRDEMQKMVAIKIIAAIILLLVTLNGARYLLKTKEKAPTQELNSHPSPAAKSEGTATLICRAVFTVVALLLIAVSFIDIIANPDRQPFTNLFRIALMSALLTGVLLKERRLLLAYPIGGLIYLLSSGSANTALIVGRFIGVSIGMGITYLLYRHFKADTRIQTGKDPLQFSALSNLFTSQVGQTHPVLVLILILAPTLIAGTTMLVELTSQPEAISAGDLFDEKDRIAAAESESDIPEPLTRCVLGSLLVTTAIEGKEYALETRATNECITILKRTDINRFVASQTHPRHTACILGGTLALRRTNRSDLRETKAFTDLMNFCAKESLE